MAVKTGEYRIVGRYMSGAEVNGYHLISNQTGAGQRFSREQVILLVGRGQISNCSASLSGDKVVLTGIGCELSKLPVQQEGKIEAKYTNGDMSTSVVGLYLEKEIVRDLNTDSTVGYVVRHSNGKSKNLSSDHVLELLQNDKFVNAKLAEVDGYYVLRDVNGNALTLPQVTAAELGLNINGNGIDIDNQTIKDSKIRLGISTRNADIDSIPVKDDIDKAEYREHKNWIDSTIELLRNSFVRENTDFNSKLNGRFINPEIIVSSAPGGSSPVVVLTFNIHYDQRGFKRKDDELSFCKMALSKDGNKAVCRMGFHKCGYHGDMQVYRSNGTADQAGVDKFWSELTRHMHLLIVSGSDTTRPADPTEEDLRKNRLRKIFN